MPDPPVARQLTWDETVEHLGGSLWVMQGAGKARQSGWGSSGGNGTVGPSARASVTQGDFHDVYVQTETSSRQEPEAIVDWRLLTSWVGVGTPQPPVTFPVEMRADRWAAEVEADGTTVHFHFVGQHDASAAVGMVGENQVLVTARSWPADEVRLVREVAPARVASPPHR